MGVRPLLWTPGLISYSATLEGGNRESLLLWETQHTWTWICNSVLLDHDFTIRHIIVSRASYGTLEFWR